jgi:hypothetical protein
MGEICSKSGTDEKLIHFNLKPQGIKPFREPRQSQSHVTTDGQSVSPSVFESSPNWGS